MKLPTRKIHNTFSELYSEMHFQNKHLKRIDAVTRDCLEKGIEEKIREYRVSIPYENRDYKQSERIQMIVTITGDDKGIVALNRYVTSVHLFLPSAFLSKDILSAHDTLISDRLGNYTEGYIMLPPHKNASFDSVQRKFRGNAMAMTFDICKLKQFLPNSKGAGKKVDLSDKFERAINQYDWMDNLWAGKTPAGLAVIYMMTAFNFREAKTFPFLYKSEGGCGGAPPFDNLDTVKSAAYYYKGGRAAKGIAAIMEESVLIQEVKIKPRDGIATQAMHLAQTGVPLEKIYGIFKGDYAKLTAVEKEARMRDLTGRDNLPEELMNKSILIEPEDKLVGAVIAELRGNKMLMTELDVRMAILGQKRYEALFEDKPMGEVLRELERERSIEKRAGENLLVKFAEQFPVETDLMSSADKYYRMRSNRSDITGLSYAGMIRIFKTSDVDAALKCNTNGLVDEVLASLGTRNNYGERQKYGFAKVKFDQQIEGLSQGLKTMIESPIPGMSSDDARIGLIAKNLDEKIPLFVITNDIRMMKILPVLHEKSYRIRTDDYLYAKAEVNYRNRRVSRGIKGIQVHMDREASHRLTYVKTEQMEQYQGSKAMLCYDYNNINRRYAARKSGKGYLSKYTARDTCYAQMSRKDFCNLRDFRWRK